MRTPVSSARWRRLCSVPAARRTTSSRLRFSPTEAPVHPPRPSPGGYLSFPPKEARRGTSRPSGGSWEAGGPPFGQGPVKGEASSPPLGSRTRRQYDASTARALARLSDELFAAEASAYGVGLEGVEPGALQASAGTSSLDAPPRSSSGATPAEVTAMMAVLMGDAVGGAAVEDVAPRAPAFSLAGTREEKVLALIRWKGSGEAALYAARELLLQGMDLKAVLKSGTLQRTRLRQTSFRQCDWSGLALVDVQAEACDFTRSLFFATKLHRCTFVRCRFDGSVWKRAVCVGPVRFEDCSFCFSTLHLQVGRSGPGLSGAPHAPSPAQRERDSGAPSHDVFFERCNFDLADFEGCSGLGDAEMYRNCINTATAANFPLRVPRR